MRARVFHSDSKAHIFAEQKCHQRRKSLSKYLTFPFLKFRIKVIKVERYEAGKLNPSISQLHVALSNDVILMMDSQSTVFSAAKVLIRNNLAFRKWSLLLFKEAEHYWTYVSEWCIVLMLQLCDLACGNYNKPSIDSFLLLIYTHNPFFLSCFYILHDTSFQGLYNNTLHISVLETYVSFIFWHGGLPWIREQTTAISFTGIYLSRKWICLVVQQYKKILDWSLIWIIGDKNKASETFIILCSGWQCREIIVIDQGLHPIWLGNRYKAFLSWFFLHIVKHTTLCIHLFRFNHQMLYLGQGHSGWGV